MPDQITTLILVRSTLLAGLTDRFGAQAPAVRLLNQPQLVGATEGPAVTMQPILNRRYGALRRAYAPGLLPEDPMVSTSTQWWECTIQIGAFARRNPNAPDFLTLPTALDYCTAASDILQSDAGMAALEVQRVRPLRITDVRTTPWKNEADQYEMNVSFDLTLSYPTIIVSETAPAAVFENLAGRV